MMPLSANVVAICGVAIVVVIFLFVLAWVSVGRENTNTSIARQGELGIVLPPAPSGTVYKRGSEVEVGWSIRANVCPHPTPTVL